MQTMRAELGSSSKSLRLIGKCCTMAQPPVALRPFSGFMGSVPDVSGIYSTEAVDDSGRPEFKQLFSFNPDLPSPSSTLSYDKHAGKWCIKHGSSTSCSGQSSAVHPLDLGNQVGMGQNLQWFGFGA